jgi:hypothetical protein
MALLALSGLLVAMGTVLVVASLRAQLAGKINRGPTLPVLSRSERYFWQLIILGYSIGAFSLIGGVAGAVVGAVLLVRGE